MKSGVQDHIAKFKDTLGSDKGYREFVQEMEGVLSAKVEFGILPKELEGVKSRLRSLNSIWHTRARRWSVSRMRVTKSGSRASASWTNRNRF